MSTVTREVQDRLSSAACAAKIRATPTGEIKVVAGEVGASAYGPVEIAWYSDHLEITALDAGRASISEGRPSGDGQDLVVEIRPPSLEELVETVPGAD